MAADKAMAILKVSAWKQSMDGTSKCLLAGSAFPEALKSVTKEGRALGIP